jgi:oligosaccharide repeat unit polymerase
MMALTAALLLAVVAGLNRRIAGSWLYPPAFFTAYWSVLLFALSASGDMFYPISPATVMLLFVGKLAFSLGGLLVLFTLGRRWWNRLPDLDPRRKIIVCHILDTSLLLLLAALPFYWALLQNSSKSSGMKDFWMGVRYHTSVVSEGRGFGVFSYIMYYSTILSLVALNEFDGKRQRWRPAALILISLIYEILSMARSFSLILIFGLLGVYWIRVGRINARSVLLAGVVTLALFTSVAVVLSKGANASDDLYENVSSLFSNIQLYLLGGIVALDRYVMGVVPIDAGPRTFRFFAILANLFGANLYVPALILPETETPSTTNVYTLYFTYYSDFGSLGVMGIMLAVGGTATLVYLGARRGHSPSVILYGLLLASLLLSIGNDTLLTALSAWLQAIVLIFAIYSLPLTLLFPNGSSTTNPDSSGGAPPGKSFVSRHRHRIEDKLAGTGSG